jgi:EmrB/QacA subfamily drug resistance transporter
MSMPRNRRSVLLLLCMAQLMIAIDFSVVNVALPSIQADLGLSDTGVQWVITGFAVCFGGLLMLGGRAGDLFGRRRVFLGGLWLFAASCVLAGVAQSAAMLLIGRALQGVAGALVAPNALALLTTSFTEGRERNRALGIYGAVLSAGFVIGVLVGGLLTGSAGWRWVMFVNVPPTVLAAVAGPMLLTESRRDTRHVRLDLPGALTISIAVASLVFAFSSAGSAGWLSAGTLGFGAASAVLLLLFVAVERRSAAPLIPLDVLGKRSVLASNAVGITTFAACGGAVFALALYMHDVLGYTPMQSGLAFCILGLAAIVAGLRAEAIAERLGARAALTMALALQALSTLALIGLPAHGAPLLLLGATAVIGFGHVLAVVSFTAIATSGASAEEQGVVGGFVNTTLQVGAAFGVSLYGAIALGSDTGPTLERFHWSFVAGAAIVVVGIAITTLGLHSHGERGTATRLRSAAGRRLASRPVRAPTTSTDSTRN